MSEGNTGNENSFPNLISDAGLKDFLGMSSDEFFGFPHHPTDGFHIMEQLFNPIDTKNLPPPPSIPAPQASFPSVTHASGMAPNLPSWESNHLQKGMLGGLNHSQMPITMTESPRKKKIPKKQQKTERHSSSLNISGPQRSPYPVSPLPPSRNTYDAQVAGNQGHVSVKDEKALMEEEQPTESGYRIVNDTKIQGGQFSTNEMNHTLPKAGSFDTENQCRTKCAIQSFDATTKALPGYTRDSICKIGQLLCRGMKLSREAEVEISLGKPSVAPTMSKDLFVVGTDNPDSKLNYLICVSSNILKKTIDGNPIVSTVRLSEHIRDTHWINSNLVLCATGKDVEIIQVENEGKSMKSRGKRTLHHDLIREIAPHPIKRLEVASGGYDKKLCVHNLQKGTRLHEQATSDTIGSVKWHPYQSDVLGCTLDYGGLQQYDTRLGLSKPTFKMNTGKPELYTHSCIDEYGMLLGYGDGIIQYIDQRYPRKILLRVEDPYVGGIGDIIYNDQSKSFVVSGLSDFSVWKMDDSQGKAYIWSHMSASTNKNRDEYSFATSTAYLNPNTVVMCDRRGYASVFQQGFS
mmetsp:Transcript_17768/g.28380  ORF Transcript_17768/g.28380 Transcript_17768/m.28380 type:complete len:575 (+) Transcript_17768:566-2290(+)